MYINILIIFFCNYNSDDTFNLNCFIIVLFLD